MRKGIKTPPHVQKRGAKRRAKNYSFVTRTDPARKKCIFPQNGACVANFARVLPRFYCPLRPFGSPLLLSDELSISLADFVFFVNSQKLLVRGIATDVKSNKEKSDCVWRPTFYTNANGLA